MNIQHNTRPTRVALVTGASRGIGVALARRLAADGFSVAVNYASNATEANAVVASIEQAGAGRSPYVPMSPTRTR